MISKLIKLKLNIFHAILAREDKRLEKQRYNPKFNKNQPTASRDWYSVQINSV